MAYFPNGTAGMMYEEEFCNRCAHNQNPDKGCHVMLVHLVYNYDQCKETPEGKIAKEILSTLIPTAENGIDSLQCSMFISARVPRPALRETQLSLWKGKP